MAETWDESKPAGSRSPTLGDDDIREFKRAVRERLAEDHDFEATESPAFGASDYTIGKHKYCTLLEQSTDKTTLANEIALEAKLVGSNSELYVVPESAGTPLLITRGNVSKLNATTFNDGTQDISFPTNGMAAAKFMLGDSNTIAWFYLNAAPPGWKVLATGADMVLAVAGGSQAYNVLGGNPDSVATWARGDCTLTTDEIPAHTHGSAGNHTHNVAIGSGSGGLSKIKFSAEYSGETTQANAAQSNGAHEHSSVGGGTGHNHGSTWRPKASVGKLFQLDTA